MPWGSPYGRSAMDSGSPDSLTVHQMRWQETRQLSNENLAVVYQNQYISIIISVPIYQHFLMTPSQKIPNQQYYEPSVTWTHVVTGARK